MSDDDDGVLATFSTKGLEAPVDAYMEDCRQLALTASPSAADLGPEAMMQAVVSMAVQRIMQWAARQQLDGVDADVTSSQAIIGLLTGLGTGLAMFGYSPEDVLGRGRGVVLSANRDARAAARAAMREGPWD